MKRTGLALSLLLAVPVMAKPATKTPPPSPAQISGEYAESRDADVYTGPCFANSEVNLTGQDAVLAWHVDRGTWGNVALDGLSVVAVVRASATLGDPYANPLPAKAKFIVDVNANDAQRAALVNFAQAQAGALLASVVAVEALPIQFAMGNEMGVVAVNAGDEVRLTTRALTGDDMICHNEEVYYQPLAAHLVHAMPAVETRSTYRGAELGINWSESNRRSSFVGNFAF